MMDRVYLWTKGIGCVLNVWITQLKNYDQFGKPLVSFLNKIQGDNS